MADNNSIQTMENRHEQQMNQFIWALRKCITAESFSEAFMEFIRQAEENSKTHLSNGLRNPYGFDEKNKLSDITQFHQHFGQGAASKTPYVNWWVVSIYYVVDIRSFVLGIEENRYAELSKMKPLRIKRIGNKKVNVAVFYEIGKDSLNCYELYERFMSVCEEVVRLTPRLYIED